MNTEENNDDTKEQGRKSPKIVKIQNRGCEEQIKLNNNVDESSVQSSRTSIVLSNGSQSIQTPTSNCDDFLEQSTCSPNANSSSSLANSKILNATAGTQLKCQNVSNHCNPPSVPKSQMHLNLTANQSNAYTHPASIQVSCASNTASNASVRLNVLPDTTSIVTSSEDNYMRNNVDYGSGIEKCPSKVSCSSESSPEVDWASKSYSSQCILNNIGGSIGSTSQGTCCFLRPNINGNRETPGPSGLQRTHHKEKVERHDSSSGNEGDMSDGEDYCIYTYKGSDDIVHMDQDRQLNENHVREHEMEGQCHSRRSSPEMDFLEMDFDPGPSCEQDTGDSDLASINEDIQNITLDNIEADPVLNDLSGGKVISRQGITSILQNSIQSGQNVCQLPPQPSTSNNSVTEKCSKPIQPAPWIPSTSTGIAWRSSALNRITECPLRESYGYHNTSGDLISPGENRDSDSELWVESSVTAVPENSNFHSRKNNLSSTLYHRMMAKKLMLNKQAAFNQSDDSNSESNLSNEQLDGLAPIEKVMLWNEQEATKKQVTQIATSACGATSAINALLALNVPFSLEVLVRGVDTRLREPGAPLPRYLMSRSMAGATHKDLARGISLATNGAAVTKFFAFYPERKVSLSHWLHYWISKGAAPIATLNLQHCGEGCDIPDAWHHQMIFGVGPAGIYLTNPLECLPEQLLWHQLVSPSVLLVRRADVLAHWNANTDLLPLKTMGQRWRKFNVLGQVVNMVREAMSQRQSCNTTNGPTHIRIPASYQAGITLVMNADSPTATELLHAEQLPLL